MYRISAVVVLLFVVLSCSQKGTKGTPDTSEPVPDVEASDFRSGDAWEAGGVDLFEAFDSGFEETVDTDTPGDLADVGADAPDLPDVAIDTGTDLFVEVEAETKGECEVADDCLEAVTPGICQLPACEEGKCVVVEAPPGTACDDGQECTVGDSCLEGACDQFEAVECEWDCEDEEDEDGDFLTDCKDPDCYGVGDCKPPECGDEECNGSETCEGCPGDCGECPAICGDGILNLEQGEECDDGNSMGGDGCSENCGAESAPAYAGDIVITEIMKSPEAGDEAAGEWFEIYNVTSSEVDLNAWFIKDSNDDEHRIFRPGGVIVPPGGYYVLGSSDDLEVNGGVEVGYVYSDFSLSDDLDQVIITSVDADDVDVETGASPPTPQTIIVDKVYYDNDSFPSQTGKALSLTWPILSAEANDEPENWCVALDQFGDGDFGSPGSKNPECPVCGDKSCDGEEHCGNCPGDCICEEAETCIDGECCNPFCAGKQCGDDGCGGVCGECTVPGFDCVDGECFCQFDCAGKECGGDGCGGTCGTCDPGVPCVDGACED